MQLFSLKKCCKLVKDSGIKIVAVYCVQNDNLENLMIGWVIPSPFQVH